MPYRRMRACSSPARRTARTTCRPSRRTTASSAVCGTPFWTAASSSASEHAGCSRYRCRAEAVGCVLICKWDRKLQDLQLPHTTGLLCSACIDNDCCGVGMQVIVAEMYASSVLCMRFSSLLAHYCLFILRQQHGPCKLRRASSDQLVRSTMILTILFFLACRLEKFVHERTGVEPRSWHEVREDWKEQQQPGSA